MEMSAEEAVVRLLEEKKWMVTTVESCTAGLLSAAIVNVPGASRVFSKGFITYSDEAKHDLVGVSLETLKKHTAVSEETAGEMALGGAKTAGAQCALSVTGIAGPGGGSEAQPVGLVYIGCAVLEKVTVKRHVFAGDRMEVRMQAVTAALELLEKCLSENEK